MYVSYPEFIWEKDTIFFIIWEEMWIKNWFFLILSPLASITHILCFSLEISLDINNLCKVLVLVVYDIYQLLVLTQRTVNKQFWFLQAHFHVKGNINKVGKQSGIIWDSNLHFLYIYIFATVCRKDWRESTYLFLVPGKMNIDYNINEYWI